MLNIPYIQPPNDNNSDGNTNLQAISTSSRTKGAGKPDIGTKFYFEGGKLISTENVFEYIDAVDFGEESKSNNNNHNPVKMV